MWRGKQPVPQARSDANRSRRFFSPTGRSTASCTWDQTNPLGRNLPVGSRKPDPILRRAAVPGPETIAGGSAPNWLFPGGCNVAPPPAHCPRFEFEKPLPRVRAARNGFDDSIPLKEKRRVQKNPGVTCCRPSAKLVFLFSVRLSAVSAVPSAVNAGDLDATDGAGPPSERASSLEGAAGQALTPATKGERVPAWDPRPHSASVLAASFHDVCRRGLFVSRGFGRGLGEGGNAVVGFERKERKKLWGVHDPPSRSL